MREIDTQEVFSAAEPVSESFTDGDQVITTFEPPLPPGNWEEIKEGLQQRIAEHDRQEALRDQLYAPLLAALTRRSGTRKKKKR